MKSKSQSSSSANKPSLDVLVESLLKEAAEDFQESPQLKWEWEHYLRLSSLIQKIRERETGRDSQDLKPNESGGDGDGVSSASTTSPEEDKRRAAEVPEFIQWLKNNHVELEKVTVGAVTEGFGLKTNKPMKCGDVAFSVPKNIVISAEKARNSKLSILIDKDPILRHMQNVLLAVFLLYEKYVNQDSFWKPYVRIIPASFDTIAYYSEEEMELLKVNQRAFREGLRMYKAIARQYAYFHTIFKSSTVPAGKGLKKIFTYNRYIWAVSAVSTRVNNWPNANDRLCMIPLLDLCNHGEGGVISTDYDDNAESFLCYAAQDFEKGTEFKMFYGHRSSIDFLIHNGFVPNNYRDDVYLLDLSLGSSAANGENKLKLLREVGMEGRMTFQLSPMGLAGARKLFAFINIFIASDEKLRVYMDINKDSLAETLESSTPECLQYLHDRLGLMRRVAENGLATTVRKICAPSKDEENSKSGEPESNCSKANRNLLQLLRNELKLLEMLVHSCKQLKISSEKSSLTEGETNNSVPGSQAENDNDNGTKEKVPV